MIPLHDKVQLVYEVATGERDSRGNPITESVDVMIPAEVQALSSSDAPDTTLLARYKIILAPVVGLPTTGWQSMAIHWRDLDLDVDGTIDTITVRGRVHHYELTTKRLA